QFGSGNRCKAGRWREGRRFGSRRNRRGGWRQRGRGNNHWQGRKWRQRVEWVIWICPQQREIGQRAHRCQQEKHSQQIVQTAAPAARRCWSWLRLSRRRFLGKRWKTRLLHLFNRLIRLVS